LQLQGPGPIICAIWPGNRDLSTSWVSSVGALLCIPHFLLPFINCCCQLGFCLGELIQAVARKKQSEPNCPSKSI
jgi:hypothetical protein